MTRNFDEILGFKSIGREQVARRAVKHGYRRYVGRQWSTMYNYSLRYEARYVCIPCNTGLRASRRARLRML
eukprot:2315852-Pleurochrysis_carterae.AAC.1